MTFQTSSTSLETTEQLAAQFGARLRGGEVIALSSDLGGGKTAFVRGLARGMGSSDHVASPTFTIGREYKANDLTLYHFDFYRLSEPGIIAHELAEALTDPSGVIAIEWGEIVQSVLPQEKLLIQIGQSGSITREFTFVYPESMAYLVERKSHVDTDYSDR